MSTVTTGYYRNTSDLMKIAEYMKNVSQGRKIAHHIWIDRVTDDHMYYTLDEVRKHADIMNVIKSRFPGNRVMNVSDCDEVYYAVSPEGAGNSDRFLVDCHYDAPFAFLPTFGVRFYRVIVACNHNEHVKTTFPQDDIAVTMDTGDFHGLDFNTDNHCVYGTIPKDKYRVLLKLHYVVFPSGMHENSWQVRYVRGLNAWWIHKSREIMRISAEPSNAYEQTIALLGNMFRFVYLRPWILIIALVLLVSVVVMCKK